VSEHYEHLNIGFVYLKKVLQYLHIELGNDEEFSESKLDNLLFFFQIILDHSSSPSISYLYIYCLDD
jgi:hypothetical protein